MQHNVISVPRQLVVSVSLLQQYFGPGDARVRGGKFEKELRINHQFPVLFDRQGNLPFQPSNSCFRRSLGKLDGAMKHRKQAKMAYITNKDATAGPYQPRRSFKDSPQIVDVRKILNDRVDHHRVYGAWRLFIQFRRFALKQLDMAEPGFRRGKLTQSAKGNRRQIGSAIDATPGRQFLKQQTDAATDLKH